MKSTKLVSRSGLDLVIPRKIYNANPTYTSDATPQTLAISTYKEIILLRDLISIFCLISYIYFNYSYIMWLDACPLQNCKD